MAMIRTYSELVKFESFKERYLYLKLGGKIGELTFGYERFLNQRFYNDPEWKRIRDYVIVRDTKGDYCCDLGVEGYGIYGQIIIHHMNPITIRDILDRSKFLLEPEFLISTSFSTHNAIHYGSDDIVPNYYVERRPNDTCPWKK